MYPAYIEIAKHQNEKSAQKSFEWALSAEKTHEKMFKQAKQALEAGEDPDIGEVQVCAVCGHTIKGKGPDSCPICGTDLARKRPTNA